MERPSPDSFVNILTTIDFEIIIKGKINVEMGLMHESFYQSTKENTILFENRDLDYQTCYRKGPSSA